MIVHGAVMLAEVSELLKKLRENPLLRSTELLTASILIYLLERANIRQIAEILGKPYTSAYYVVKKLCELGIAERVIEFSKESPRVEQYYRLTERGVKLLFETLKLLQLLHDKLSKTGKVSETLSSSELRSEKALIVS